MSYNLNTQADFQGLNEDQLLQVWKSKESLNLSNQQDLWLVHKVNSTIKLWMEISIAFPNQAKDMLAKAKQFYPNYVAPQNRKLVDQKPVERKAHVGWGPQ